MRTRNILLASLCLLTITGCKFGSSSSSSSPAPAPDSPPNILFIVLTPGLVALGSDAVGQAYPAWLRVVLVGWTLGGLVLIGLYLRRPARR